MFSAKAVSIKHRTGIDLLIETHEELSDIAKRLHALPENGTYSHNIASIYLREVQKEYGTKISNALVDKFKLTEKFAIEKVKL